MAGGSVRWKRHAVAAGAAALLSGASKSRRLLATAYWDARPTGYKLVPGEGVCLTLVAIVMFLSCKEAEASTGIHAICCAARVISFWLLLYVVISFWLLLHVVISFWLLQYVVVEVGVEGSDSRLMVRYSVMNFGRGAVVRSSCCRIVDMDPSSKPMGWMIG